MRARQYIHVSERVCVRVYVCVFVYVHWQRTFDYGKSLENPGTFDELVDTQFVTKGLLIKKVWRVWVWVWCMGVVVGVWMWVWVYEYVGFGFVWAWVWIVRVSVCV